MQWGGVTRVGMLAPTLDTRVLAIMAHLCHACGRGFEQQVPRRSLSGKAASSVRSQFACYFVRS